MTGSISCLSIRACELDGEEKYEREDSRGNIRDNENFPNGDVLHSFVTPVHVQYRVRVCVERQTSDHEPLRRDSAGPRRILTWTVEIRGGKAAAAEPRLLETIENQTRHFSTLSETTCSFTPMPLALSSLLTPGHWSCTSRQYVSRDLHGAPMGHGRHWAQKVGFRNAAATLKCWLSFPRFNRVLTRDLMGMLGTISCHIISALHTDTVSESGVEPRALYHRRRGFRPHSVGTLPRRRTSRFSRQVHSFKFVIGM